MSSVAEKILSSVTLQKRILISLWGSTLKSSSRPNSFPKVLCPNATTLRVKYINLEGDKPSIHDRQIHVGKFNASTMLIIVLCTFLLHHPPCDHNFPGRGCRLVIHSSMLLKDSHIQQTGECFLLMHVFILRKYNFFL